MTKGLFTGGLDARNMAKDGIKYYNKARDWFVTNVIDFK